jgi:GTP cyclohydrolase I
LSERPAAPRRKQASAAGGRSKPAPGAGRSSKPAPAASPLADVHARPDLRKLPLDRAGVKDLRYPISVLDRAQGVQHTIATIDLSVSLPERKRGAHMSRFIELLNRHRREIDIRKFRALAAELRREAESDAAFVEVRFPYFIEKAAPVSKAVGLVDYACTFGAAVRGGGQGGRGPAGSSGPEGNGAERSELWVAAEVPVTSLCPCSKEISRFGAHNQRSIVRVKVWFEKFFWLEDLISLVEASASAELYALLKRPDEKHVTERAYQRPRFVEDLVREVGTRLRADANFTRWEIVAESLESIHAHNAYASLAWPQPG